MEMKAMSAGCVIAEQAEGLFFYGEKEDVEDILRYVDYHNGDVYMKDIIERMKLHNGLKGFYSAKPMQHIIKKIITNIRLRKMGMHGPTKVWEKYYNDNLTTKQNVAV